jgi:hypothetical protein
MHAKFDIMKFTGKLDSFGTPISGTIGLKRIDEAVPAVFQKLSNGQSALIPSDDSSNAGYYCVYRPDCDAEVAYSYESVVKLVLREPPDNQVSNIRIYPKQAPPNDPDMAILYIGCAQTYTRPTNGKSLTALHNIWEFTKENPFLVTCGGAFGQVVDTRIRETVYTMTCHDLGLGNLLYANGERQADIVVPIGKTIQILDKTLGLIGGKIHFYDNATGADVSTHPAIKYFDMPDGPLVTVAGTVAFATSFPRGVSYGSESNPNIGGRIAFIDISRGEEETYELNVEVRPDPEKGGVLTYYFDDVRAPDLMLAPDTKFILNNHSGAHFPLRLFNVFDVPPMPHEDMYALDGVTVENGGTNNEVVTIESNKVNRYHRAPKSYASVSATCIGGHVFTFDPRMIGRYNINRVGAGTGNPLSAGETDFIYLQLKVTGRTTPGRTTPDLVFEYDES